MTNYTDGLQTAIAVAEVHEDQAEAFSAELAESPNAKPGAAQEWEHRADEAGRIARDLKHAMAANPREAERALPSVEREARIRTNLRHELTITRLHMTPTREHWQAVTDLQDALALIDAARAENAAIRAENSRLRAVVGALQYGDGGRAPVSRIVPEREPDTAPSQFFAAGRCRVCGSVQAAGYYPTIEEAKEGAEAFRRVSGLADTFGPLLPGMSLTIAPRCDCEAGGEGAL